MVPRLLFWKRSIFVRLLLIFVIIMIPIYLIGLGMYKWWIGTLQEEILKSKFSQISFYMTRLEREIQGIKLLQSDVVMGDDINRLANGEAYMDDYEKGFYMLKLQQRLAAIKSSSAYIAGVKAFIPSIRRTIPEWGSIEELTEHEKSEMGMHENATFAQLIYDKEDIVLNSFFPLNYVSKSVSPLYALQIRLSSDELRNAIGQFDVNSGSGSMMIDTQNRFMVNTGDNPVVTDQIRSALEGLLQQSGDGKSSIAINGSRYLVIYKTSSYLGMTLCNYIPEDQLYSPVRKYRVWVWGLSAASVALAGIFAYSIYRIIRRPLKHLIQAFKRIETGNMKVPIRYRYDDEFGFLYNRFNTMTERLNTLIDQSYKQTILIQRAELKQLQAQINPHFLYNSFFILYTMTKREDYDQLMKFQLQLGEYFQFLTRNTSDDVPLEAETDHARTYCDIQAIRFQKRIRIRFGDVPAKFAGMNVPRLILQPIIENAFEHGLESKEESGLLQIQFHASSEALSVTIDDNGELLSDEQIVKLQTCLDSGENVSEITGIVNIHRRIRLYFGESSGIAVARSELGGLAVRLTMVVAESEFRGEGE